MISDLDMLVRLVLAAGLGALIGLDRETRQKPAGLRTFSIVSLGACIFTLVAEMAFVGDAEASRVVSTIITGVGFLGAGTIIHRQSDVLGLTTAAGIWASAGVGMAVGMGLYGLAVGSAILIVAVLWILGWLAARVARDVAERSGEGSRTGDGSRSGDGSGDGGEDDGDEGRATRFDGAEDIAKRG